MLLNIRSNYGVLVVIVSGRLGLVHHAKIDQYYVYILVNMLLNDLLCYHIHRASSIYVTNQFPNVDPF